MSQEILRCDKEDDGKIHTHITLLDGYNYHHYGLLIADIIHHTSVAFDVPVDDVCEWVNKELNHPTTDITQVVGLGIVKF